MDAWEHRRSSGQVCPRRCCLGPQPHLDADGPVSPSWPVHPPTHAPGSTCSLATQPICPLTFPVLGLSPAPQASSSPQSHPGQLLSALSGLFHQEVVRVTDPTELQEAMPPLRGQHMRAAGIVPVTEGLVGLAVGDLEPSMHSATAFSALNSPEQGKRC